LRPHRACTRFCMACVRAQQALAAQRATYRWRTASAQSRSARAALERCAACTLVRVCFGRGSCTCRRP
jgi:hypothetical protein